MKLLEKINIVLSKLFIFVFFPINFSKIIKFLRKIEFFDRDDKTITYYIKTGSKLLYFPSTVIWIAVIALFTKFDKLEII